MKARHAVGQFHGSTGRAGALAAMLLLCVPLVAFADPDPAATAIQRGRAFWLKLAADCKVPKGESAAGLVDEAVSLLGSRDPLWRDDVGYGVFVSCVYQKRALSPAERGALAERLTVNLRRGLGESGTDTVLLRSFSALDLSILVALEQQDPVLDAAGYRSVLDGALAYLQEERDGRGFDPDIGWIHATAHTADLLKFLARDPRFTPADQLRLFDATWAKATSAETPGWSHGEEERLASALLSVTRRTDFDIAPLDPWLAKFVALEKNVRDQGPDADRIEAGQNARRLLQSFFVMLSLEQPTPTSNQVTTRAKVLETLRQIRR